MLSEDNKEINHGSLFTGIGGFDVAAQQIGWVNVFQVENNAFCQKVLAKNFPLVKRYGDIKQFNARDYRGLLDVVTGGFPCKQTSVSAAIHQKRSGLEGVDSSLWFEQIRVLEDCRPTWAVVENVAGVKKWEDTIKSGLEGIGFTVSKVEFEAVDFGLPHKRRRCFYVANAHGKRLEITRQPGTPTTDWVKRLAIDGGSWLSSTPGTIGSFNGLPNRVDRINALGNACIPAMALEIFKAIEALVLKPIKRIINRKIL
jgi:DNA (cytosine-5)-methyltransferase 1